MHIIDMFAHTVETAFQLTNFILGRFLHPRIETSIRHGPYRVDELGHGLHQMPRQTRDYVERASALHDAYVQALANALRPRLQTAL